VFNNDDSGPLEISYGMAYFGLDMSTSTTVEPGSLTVRSGDGVPATRLKEVVQSLVRSERGVEL